MARRKKKGTSRKPTAAQPRKRTPARKKAVAKRKLKPGVKKKAVKKKAARKKAKKAKKATPASASRPNKRAASSTVGRQKAAVRKKKRPQRVKRAGSAPQPAASPRLPAASPRLPAARPRPPAARPRPPAARPRPARSAAASPVDGTPLVLPSNFQDTDHLPLWFGGYGLTHCFTRLNVATVGDLRTRTEEQIREVCGTSDLVRLKARIEYLEEKVLASELEPSIEDTLWPASENFAYFLKGGAVSSDGHERASSKHVCEIILRPDSQRVTVRLGARMHNHWQDVTVPLDQLELVSRPDRRAELAALTPLELAGLVSTYELKLADNDDRVDKLLSFEFSEFGKSW